MFDIGFWEIMVIAVVALIVVGPERFPGMIKKIGYWVGQFRRMASAIKNEFQQEVEKADQLQKLMEEQKQIVERHANLDITQPAVKPKSAQEAGTEIKPASDAKITGSDTRNPPQE